MTAEGWQRWVYSRDGRKPVAHALLAAAATRALDDPDEACNLAREALRELS